MTTKAMQLADALENDPMPLGWYIEAADELRRLHEVNAELVEALKPFVTIGSGFDSIDLLRGREAIAKATGEQYEN